MRYNVSIWEVVIMDLQSKQNKFDREKWGESSKLGRDLCGTYDFCAFCDKSLEYPCANAMQKLVDSKQEKSEQKEQPKSKRIKVATFKQK